MQKNQKRLRLMIYKHKKGYGLQAEGDL